MRCRSADAAQTPFGGPRPSGRAGGTRTPDHRIRNPMLYPAELLPHQVARQAREGGTKNDRIRKLKDENKVRRACEYALTFP